MSVLQFFFLSIGLFATKSTLHVQALPAEEILGGDLTLHQNYPYTVVLRVSTPGALIAPVHCSGSILDDYHVLSAAHCFINERTGEWRNEPVHIVAGLTDLYQEVEDLSFIKINIQKVFVPKMFFSSIEEKSMHRNGNYTPLAGDIAVVKLFKSLNLKENGHLGSVKLASNGSFVGQKAVVSGYGWSQLEVIENDNGELEEIDQVSDGKLRFANTYVISNDDCNEMYYKRDEEKVYRVEIRNTFLCARVDQRVPDFPEGVCGGDSGGPLVINNDTLIGVVNESPLGCNEDESPGIYARVSVYKNFITKVLKNIRDPDIITNQLVMVNTDLLDKFD